MFKNEKEQFICKEIPNLKLRFKNKDEIILETVSDTLTFFNSKISNGNQEINFKIATLSPEEYRTIIENITAITEVCVTAEFLFRGTSGEDKDYEITYPPFNRIVVTKELGIEGEPSCFEFNLYKY